MNREVFDTFEEYIARFPENVQEKLNLLRGTIRAAAPAAKEKFSYSMPTYDLNGNLVHFAGYKNHIGFYPTPSAIEKFADELKPFVHSKGAVQFALDKPLPVDLVRRMVEFRVSEMNSAAKK